MHVYIFLAQHATWEHVTYGHVFFFSFLLCGLHVVVVGVSCAVFGVITDCVKGVISLHPHQ